MDPSILAWLLEEENPETRLRTLKEYEKLPNLSAALMISLMNWRVSETIWLRASSALETPK